MLVGAARNSQSVRPAQGGPPLLGENAGTRGQRHPDSRTRSRRGLCTGVAILICLLLSACGGGRKVERQSSISTASTPGARQPVLSAAAKDVLFNAISLVGTPYRYGGNTPASGFDCSGLVGYVYRQGAGLNLPRTTAEISRVDGRRVRWGQLVSGDLVLFGSSKVDHIGIYVGDGRFVHAPSSGGTVRLDHLTDRYWSKRFKGGRRLF